MKLIRTGDNSILNLASISRASYIPRDGRRESILEIWFSGEAGEDDARQWYGCTADTIWRTICEYAEPLEAIR